jgi:putative transposase
VIESLTGQGINVRHACRTLEVSESGYYAWKGRPDPPRTLRRIWLAGEIAEVHKASAGTYGALRVTAELRYEREIVVGHNAVGSIMRELGIKGLPTRRRPRGARLAQVISLDLVRRSFRRDRPNELWLTDITEHPTREGKLFCCVVLDAFSRLVVGWAIDSTQTTLLVLNALGVATQRREHRDGLVIHSDRGVQGGFNWSSQRSIEEGCDGQACGVDDGVDGPGADEVAGEAVVAPGRGAVVLARDRERLEQRGGRAGCGSVSGCGQPLVSGTWRDANVHACPAVWSVSVF